MPVALRAQAGCVVPFLMNLRPLGANGLALVSWNLPERRFLELLKKYSPHRSGPSKICG